MSIWSSWTAFPAKHITDVDCLLETTSIESGVTMTNKLNTDGYSGALTDGVDSRIVTDPAEAPSA